MKVCTGCKESKSLGSFGVDSKGGAGIRSRCKTCCRISRGIYNESHREQKNGHQNTLRRAHRNANPLQKRIKVTRVPSNRRALLFNATTECLPIDYWDILIGLYGTACMNPNCPGGSTLSLDHIVPLSKGGSHSMDNFQLLCRRCNSSKGNHHSTDYRPKLVGLHV